MRFLVLTSIVLTAATAVAGAHEDGQCQLCDRAPDTVAGGAVDQDSDRRPGGPPLLATTGTAPGLPDVAGGVAADPAAFSDIPRVAAVIPFAPKTSPPFARWF